MLDDRTTTTSAKTVHGSIGEYLLAAPLLVAVACTAAALFGALHNQASFTVAPSYFHEFKFLQFGTPEALRTRLGASIVGVLASWWMGLILGPLILAFAIISRPPRAMVRRFLLATAVVFTAATVSSAAGLAVARLGLLGRQTDFAAAGFMHNGAYLGAVLGAIFAAGLLTGLGIADRRALSR